MDFILREFRAHTPSPESRDYYHIIREIALLKRSYLKLFMERFRLIFLAAQKGEMKGPYRIVASTGCGFVFMACPPDLAKHQANGLLNFTLGHKYDQKLERCIGVSFLSLENGEYSVGWCYIKQPWVYDRRSKRWCIPITLLS
ncbi:hypothetical protein BH11ARM2_BH11ARM2_21290 [soil metagenome]